MVYDRKNGLFVGILYLKLSLSSAALHSHAYKL